MNAHERGTRGRSSGGRGRLPFTPPVLPPELRLDFPAELRRMSIRARLRASMEEKARAARERQGDVDADREMRLALINKAVYVTRLKTIRQSASQGLNRYFGEIASFEETPNWEATATTSIQDPNAGPNAQRYTVTPSLVFAAAQVRVNELRKIGLDASARWGRVQREARRWTSGGSIAGSSDPRSSWGSGWTTYTYNAIVMGIEVKW